VIAALPDCWKMNFEEVGIALCRMLTDEPDLLNRVISSLESAVLDEIVGRQESLLSKLQQVSDGSLLNSAGDSL
jgi:hypothetical protein